MYTGMMQCKKILNKINLFFFYRMELEYDVRNRISSQKITLGRTKIQNTMTYSADGHLFEVAGSSDWKYIYDENGNIIGVMDYGQKLTLGYDVGDRVVQVRYTYNIKKNTFMNSIL